MRLILLKIGHLFFGLYYGYPVCCVTRFAIGAGRDSRQAIDRGVCLGGTDRYGEASTFVPCGVFHQADEIFVTKESLMTIERVPCRVVRDGFSLDGERFAAGDVAQINPAFAVELEAEGEVERVES